MVYAWQTMRFSSLLATNNGKFNISTQISVWIGFVLIKNDFLFKRSVNDEMINFAQWCQNVSASALNFLHNKIVILEDNCKILFAKIVVSFLFQSKNLNLDENYRSLIFHRMPARRSAGQEPRTPRCPTHTHAGNRWSCA